MTNLTTQEIFDAAFNAGSLYQQAQQDMDRYGRNDPVASDYDFASSIVRDLQVSIKWAEQAGAKNPRAEADLIKWQEILAQEKIEHDKTIIPMDDEI